MQSRLTAIAAKSNWAFSLPQLQGLRRGLVSIPTGRTGNPSVHAVEESDPDVPSGEPETSQDVAEPDNAKANYETEPSSEDSAKADSGKEAENGPFGSPKIHYASSPRLESTAVGQSSKPLTQQKRTHTTILDEVSCVGVDGTPWPEDKEDRNTDKEDREEDDDRDYYKHHKASPLSEIEFADTRNPITRATDGTADSGYYGGGKDVIGWLPEQRDTAEEALRRATEIWKQNAMRGDPDAPHSRVLRTLRGEWF